jgi:hypothetical protein
MTGGFATLTLHLLEISVKKAIVDESFSKIIRQELLFLCLITSTVALPHARMQPIPIYIEIVQGVSNEASYL